MRQQATSLAPPPSTALGPKLEWFARPMLLVLWQGAAIAVTSRFFAVTYSGGGPSG
jgi:hypothetical protein